MIIMYKRLLAFGDSFTYGYDLPDCVDCPSKKTYAALLADWLEIPYFCHAVGSNSNQGISRSILDSDVTDTDLVLIMWTFEARQDFLFDGNRGWSSVLPNKNDSFADFFFKNIDKSDEYFAYLSHKEIYLIQNFLKQKNVQHINLSTVSSIYKSIGYRNTALSKLIDTESWLELPGPEGFYNWALAKNLIVRGGGHANEEAHKQLFDIIKVQLKK
jgi:hypothetical protein